MPSFKKDDVRQFRGSESKTESRPPLREVIASMLEMQAEPVPAFSHLVQIGCRGQLTFRPGSQECRAALILLITVQTDSEEAYTVQTLAD